VSRLRPRVAHTWTRRPGSEVDGFRSAPARLVCPCGFWVYVSRLRVRVHRTSALYDACTALQDALNRYCGREAYIAVGLCDDPRDMHLVVYTRRRSDANRLVAFVGYTFRGFKVVGRVLGRVVVARG